MKRICEFSKCGKEFEPAANETRHRRYCSKQCRRKALYWHNRPREIQRMKEWRVANPDVYKASKKKHYWAHKPEINLKAKHYQLMRDHNLTLQEYDSECAKRENKCDICGKVCPDRTLRVDHDHSTQARRGMLCDGCNLGIGKLQDSSKVLASAADYLRRFGC